MAYQKTHGLAPSDDAFHERNQQRAGSPVKTMAHFLRSSLGCTHEI
jgi:hypothetical protein